MIGTIIGDIVGSPYEGSYLRFVDDRNFPLFDETNGRFTDDTVLTCAVADALLDMSHHNGRKGHYPPDFRSKFIEWTAKYPGRGYGSAYSVWAAQGGIMKNKSYANGAMMRCSPIAFFYENHLGTDILLDVAAESIEWTHNSPEALRGVSSIVSAIWMAGKKKSKLEIKEHIEENYGHMLDLTVEQWRQHPKPNIRCNLTAPQALVCSMESTDYESAIRHALYTKGDTDTITAITGGIAQAFYGVRSIPQYMIDEAKKRMTPEMISLVNEFYEKLEKSYTKSQYVGFRI